MVAPSYASLKVLSEPFQKGNKLYITVELKSGKPKDVRYYTDREYSKAFAAQVTTPTVPGRPWWGPNKDTLGYQKGYITVFSNSFVTENDYFTAKPEIRFAEYCGWYLPSEYEMPPDLPTNIQTTRVEWTAVGTEDGYLLDYPAAKKTIYFKIKEL